MSLEQALNENTAAINALIAALKSAPAVTVTAPAAEPAAETAKETKAGKSVQKQEQAASTQPTATAAVEDAASNKQSNSDTTHNAAVSDAKQPVEIPYAEVSAVFIALAKKDRPAAVALLEEYGATKLPEVPKEKHAEVMERARALIGG